MKAANFWLVAVAVFLPCRPTLAAEAATRPNFVIINIDDLGYADIGPFGSKLNRTPNLDRMAREGRKLTCFYAAPVCSPSRSSLISSGTANKFTSGSFRNSACAPSRPTIPSTVRFGQWRGSPA